MGYASDVFTVDFILLLVSAILDEVGVAIWLYLSYKTQDNYSSSPNFNLRGSRYGTFMRPGVAMGLLRTTAIGGVNLILIVMVILCLCKKKPTTETLVLYLALATLFLLSFAADDIRHQLDSDALPICSSVFLLLAGILLFFTTIAASLGEGGEEGGE